MHDWIWFCFNAQWKLKAMSLCILVSVCDFSFVVEDFGVMVVKMGFLYEATGTTVFASGYCIG